MWRHVVVRVGIGDNAVDAFTLAVDAFTLALDAFTLVMLEMPRYHV